MEARELAVLQSNPCIFLGALGVEGALEQGHPGGCFVLEESLVPFQVVSASVDTLGDLHFQFPVSPVLLTHCNALSSTWFFLALCYEMPLSPD
jgi:hypothetical protein